MTKADIIDQISDNTGVEKKVVQLVVESFMRTVKKNLLGGFNVYLRGFGSFIKQKRAAKKGRNISAGGVIEIPAHFAVKFIPGRQFKASMKKQPISNDNSEF